MTDNRSDAVKATCLEYTLRSCVGCPLRKACTTKPGDTKEIYDQRMNEAALEFSGKK